MSGQASAFAPSEDRKGKTLAWEDIYDSPIPEAITTNLSTAVRIVGVTQTRFLTLIPVSVTRGTVTLERIRGTLAVYFSVTELAASFDNWPVHYQIQLVPARDGAITTEAILSPQNTADQESNRILWQRSYYPKSGGTITGAGAVELHESNYSGIEVDVRVKRRFDRATWALILVADVETTAGTLHVVGGHLRALFRAADGI